MPAANERHFMPEANQRQSIEDCDAKKKRKTAKYHRKSTNKPFVFQQLRDISFVFIHLRAGAGKSRLESNTCSAKGAKYGDGGGGAVYAK